MKISLFIRAIIRRIILFAIGSKYNSYHPLVLITGEPIIGKGTYIGAFSEVNARGTKVQIGENCDIASFVAINNSDSHLMTVGLSKTNIRRNIFVGDNVFIGSHSVILGGANIGHNSVIAAGTVVREGIIEPYSLVAGNPMKVKSRYYADLKISNKTKSVDG